MRNCDLAFFERFIACLLLNNLTFELDRLHVVGEVVKVDCCGLLSNKLNTLDADLRVLDIFFCQI